MSTTNEIYLRTGSQLERLDLDIETALLPTFQANDRTRPESIQADYSPEFSVPATARNHRLLGHAVNAQRPPGAAYARVPAVLTSGGVETLPLALLYIKGYSEGRYQLQIFAGNKRFLEQLKNEKGEDKKLSDLDLNRFNHAWTPANISAGLTYAHWQTNGWSYSVIDRGKPMDLQNLDPYACLPSVAAHLVWDAIIEESGFTADSLLGEELFAQAEIPTANPYGFDSDFRAARELKAGFEYFPAGNTSDGRNSDGQFHEDEFAPERLAFEFISEAPYRGPTAGATYTANHTYTADTLGYYDLRAAVTLRFGSRPEPTLGEVSCKVMLYINGQPVFDANGDQIAQEELRQKDYVTHTFTPTLQHWLLQPGDTVSVLWQGDFWDSSIGIGPSDPYWQIGPWGNTVLLPNGNRLSTQATFSVALLEEFPPSGLIRLQDWLPDMTQLSFFKSIMLLLGLTIQVDDYENHLHLATGKKLLENIPNARNWSNKLDLSAPRGRQPERSLTFKFGDYGQRSTLLWKEDENVTAGYGNGEILIADTTLPAKYEMATLAFAATEASKDVGGLLRILNYKRSDITVVPVVYELVKAEPRLTLRGPDRPLSGQIIMVPERKDSNGNTVPAVKASFTTTASYFDSAGLSLMLNKNVLSEYWADLKAMLDSSRYLVERFRLTAADVAALDYSIPVWVDAFGDYFCVSRVSEFSPNRSTEVALVRLNAAHLPAPVLLGDLREWFAGEFWNGEWY